MFSEKVGTCEKLPTPLAREKLCPGVPSLGFGLMLSANLRAALAASCDGLSAAVSLNVAVEVS